MDDSQFEVTTRPEPQVNKEKQYFADASINIPSLCQEVKRIEDQISLEEQAINRNQEVINSLGREKTGKYLEFLNEANTVLGALKPHLALEDREDGRVLMKGIDDTSNTNLYQKERITEIRDFITAALFNANLSALGPKTRIVEIMNEIDISKI
ncbi:MAG: hypothetical protein IMZ64_12895 [Bacteroidetes bacterium]|nr:hypothetical protein [Bacteroidota bacterium]